MDSIKKNHDSTWEFIESYLEKKSQNKLCDNEIQLEEQYALLTSHTDKPYYSSDFIVQKGHNTPVESFLTYFELGLYPPPCVMAAISDSFNCYLLDNGESTLEECFFGDLAKSIGNKAARQNRNMPFNHMLIIMCDESLDYSQVKAAEKVIKDLELEYDVESFIRNYRRYKKKNNYLDRLDLIKLKRELRSQGKCQK